MKVVYRVLILVVLFIGSVFFFSQGMTEHFFSDEIELMDMAEPSFPIVTMEVAGREMNALHGYASNLDEMIMRESITPLGTDRTFTILIDENESVVKKLKYEILDANGSEVESDSMIVLDTGEERKSVTITTKENLKSGSEYIAKITLVTNQSKRIYYYTRLKLYDNGHLYEKLDFVKNVHDALFDPVASLDYEKYFEPSKKADNSTFARVNLYSSMDMLTYGELDPVVLYEAVPTVTEFYENMASVALDYIVSSATEYGNELYSVRETLRFNYTSTRIYLYNYERSMNVIYNPENISLTQNELKIGITQDTDVQTVSNAGGTYFAFVYGRELMLYSSVSNDLVKVFSFRQGTQDYLRDLYDQHDVRIINVSEEGNVDFYVYGYMNRGEYEGRVGIILYRFYKSDLRLEEQAYLPINSSYQLLRYDIGEFVYRNNYDIFFFTMYNNIYSYNIVTKQLETIAEDVPNENLVFCEEEKYLAWQDYSDPRQAKSIVIMDLEGQSKIVVSATIGSNIRLFGRINNNIVYGLTNINDCYTYEDGSIFLPAYEMRICDRTGKVLKEYNKEGYYITKTDIGSSDINLYRVTNNSSGKYVAADNDYVLNRKIDETPGFTETKRITDRLLTEYYISFPKNIDIVYEPLQKTTRNTVIDSDATVRVTPPEKTSNVFYAYSYGRIIFSSKNAGEAIMAADSNVGTVIDSSGKLVWERGVKATRKEITTLALDFNSAENSLQNCMRILLAYKNVEADTTAYNTSLGTVTEWMSGLMKSTPVDLTGCSLDEVLYFVYKSRPVIAIKPDGSACLITAYDSTGITVAEPAQGRITKYGTNDAETLFAGAGNRFMSYIE